MSRLARSMVELTRFHARSLYRNKIALFFNIIFPLLMVAIFGGLYGTPAASRGGGLVDGTGRVLTAFDFLMPGQMAVMVTAAGFVTVAITMGGQRRDGSLRHLLSTPLSVGSWTAARVLANVLMAGVQGVLLFVFAALLFDVSPPANLPGTIVVVLVCTLASLSMGIFVGTLVKGEATAMAVVMPIYMVLIFLGNSAMPLLDAPRFIQVMLPWVPTYHMTEAMRAVMMFGEGLGAVTKELAILGGLAAGLLGIALALMRRQYTIR